MFLLTRAKFKQDLCSAFFIFPPFGIPYNLQKNKEEEKKVHGNGKASAYVTVSEWQNYREFPFYFSKN